VGEEKTNIKLSMHAGLDIADDLQSTEAKPVSFLRVPDDRVPERSVSETFEFGLWSALH
jgi:hypothetical protein